MSRFNEGIVYTNTKCVGCNKCISVCPAMGANVSSVLDGRTRVDVSKKCIDCGLCINECIHHARDYRDDFDRFMEDLVKGENISLLVDPSFFIDYGEKAMEMLGELKTLGVKRFFDVAYGADISIYGHIAFVKKNMDKKHQVKQFIANNCAAVAGYIENLHPNLLGLMIPVQSPAMCTAIYVRKYLGVEGKLAYLNPCISQCKERISKDNEGLIDYSFTFSSFSRFLRKELTHSSDVEVELRSKDPGNVIGYRNGFIDAVSMAFDKGEVFSHYPGLEAASLQMLNAVALSNNVGHPLMVTINACQDGCVRGNGVKSRDIQSIGVLEEYKNVRKQSMAIISGCKNPDEVYAKICDKHKGINLDDFAREYHDDFRQPYNVPEDTIEDIFSTMHKDTKLKQVVNCQSCGYKTCRELAIAVANGYASIRDCVHYMNDDLKYTALIDRMTGIPNRAGFRAKAREILDANPDKTFIIFVGNVNKLKNINDLYGSDSGDKVLCYIAKRLQEMTEGKGCCGRFGGGIFAVLLEYTPEAINPFMEHEQVNVKHLGIYFPVTIRYGCYIVDDHSLKLEDISNLCTYAADKAANRTKNTYITFDDTMRQEMQIETEITLKMREAMDNGEFVLYLQPQYDHHTGKIVGAEALTRWVKPDGSIVSPGLFIPVFEKNGFIKELDNYVWESAFKLVQGWEKEKKPMVPISVNISRVSLETDEIVDNIARLSERYPIDKNHLYFEITESAYMKDQEKLTQRVTMIKGLGFEIAMDDFGSGYSSLNTLKDIPLDVLKLDMGFLRGGTNVERGNQIIGHIVNMAKALELKIVAEGVETKEQADFLTEKGCDVIQGFYYARPMPLAEYREKLKTDL